MIFSSSLVGRLVCILIIGVGFFAQSASAERDEGGGFMQGSTFTRDVTGSAVTAPTPTPAPIPPTADDFVQLVDSNLARGVNFVKAFKADFNGDGVVDKLVCNGTNYSVTIFDGKKITDVLYRWDGPATNTLITDPSKPTVISKLLYTGCEAVEIIPGRPSVVISQAYAHPTDGVRIQEGQYVLQNRGMTTDGKLRMVPRVVRTPDTKVYRVAARSVKCVPYPAQLVRAGNKEGALCFYAGYDQALPNGQYGNKVALLKFEEVDGALIAKDVTGSSGLIWKGGVSGTVMSTFPTYKNSSGSRKYDGLNMMGGAWLDYDTDGLPDLITVGQHASIRSSKMKLDRSKPEGISFTTSNILTASKSSMTEFLSVAAFNEQDSRITLPCVYVTGEVANTNSLKSYDVPDHFRCFENGTWVTHMLPGKVYSSAMQGASIRRDTTGRTLILAPSLVSGPGGVLVSGVPASNVFEVVRPSTCQVKLESQLSVVGTGKVLQSGVQTVTVSKNSSPRIGGWVDCRATSYNAYFTGALLTSGTSNISQLGWWTEKNFLANQRAFEAIPWRNISTFVAVPGAVKGVSLQNACSNTISKITATVVSCTDAVVAMDTLTAPGEHEQVAAVIETTDDVTEGNDIVAQLRGILNAIRHLLQ